MAECALKGIPEAECSFKDKIIDDFKNANYWWVLMVLLCFTISNVSRAIRWNMLLKPLGSTPKFINSFLTIILGYFANLGFPRIGEIVRAATFSRYEKIPLEKVVGTVVVDRIFDVMSILIVTALALLLEYERIIGYVNENSVLGEKINNLFQSNALWILAGIGILGLVALFLIRDRLAQTTIYKKIVGILTGFAEGIRSVAKLDKPFWFLFHSIMIWVMYFMMTWVCFFAFEPTANLPATAGLLVFVFGAWGIVIPAPGGMGTYHALAIAALSLYGVAGDDAFSFANISFFSIQIGCNIFIGLLALLLLPIINKNYEPVVQEV